MIQVVIFCYFFSHFFKEGPPVKNRIKDNGHCPLGEGGGRIKRFPGLFEAFI